VSTRETIGVVLLACVACCIGPIFGVLGGVAAFGVVSTPFIGVAGLAVTVVAGLAFVTVRRHRRTRCSASS
jgi:hypothetical protein